MTTRRICGGRKGAGWISGVRLEPEPAPAVRWRPIARTRASAGRSGFRPSRIGIGATIAMTQHLSHFCHGPASRLAPSIARHRQSRRRNRLSSEKRGSYRPAPAASSPGLASPAVSSSKSCDTTTRSASRNPGPNPLVHFSPQQRFRCLSVQRVTQGLTAPVASPSRNWVIRSEVATVRGPVE